MPAQSAVAPEVAIAVLQNDVGYIKRAVDAITGKLDALADASLPRRVQTLEACTDDQESRLKNVEDGQLALRSEMVGAIKVLRIGLSLMTIIGIGASLLVAAHAIGALP